MTTNSLRNIRILLCLFFCFRMAPFIYAGEFLFTTINASQGLSDNQIRYILQLPDGRMVFTTSGNVNLYDGVHFSYLHRTTEYVYPLNQYNGHYRIYQSGDSLLWIKDTHKLMCIDLYREEYIPDLDAYFKNREIQAPVEDLFVDDSGHIWLLIANELLELNNKTRITLPGKYSGKLQDLNADSTSLYLFYDTGEVSCYHIADQKTVYNIAAYLNAADTSWDYGVTVYEMGTHQASGWFFYPAQYTPPTATKTVSVKSADSAKGSVSIEGKESTSVEVPETEALIVKATAADNYMFYRWVEEGTETVISYRHTYSYEGTEDKTLVAEFVEKDYPIMTRFYVTDLNQQNRYLGSVSYTAGDKTETLFTCATQEELPFTEYKKLHTPQVEGAVIDKTENPIRLEEGVENFSMNFKQYNEDITYNNGYRDIVCEPEIVWSYQTLYIDWNNDKEFSGENEIYAAVGNNSGDNTFDDPNGNVTEGWDRTITVPAETAPGTYRMRIVYMGPDPWSNDWPSKVFTEFYNEIRNGIAYDFEIAISPASGIEKYRCT